MLLLRYSMLSNCNRLSRLFSLNDNHNFFFAGAIMVYLAALVKIKLHLCLYIFLRFRVFFQWRLCCILCGDVFGRACTAWYLRCFTVHVSILRTVPQGMVHQYQCKHGFHNRCGANTNARVMSSVSLDNYRGAIFINGVSPKADTGCWFDGDIDRDILPGGNTA